MTNQEKKRWLQECGKLDRAINQKLDEYERVKSLCEKMSSTITGMPRGGGGAGREGWYVRLIELSQEIDKDTDRYVDKRREIEDAINNVGDANLRVLLRRRYIDGFSWRDIAVELDIPECTVRGKMHYNALNTLYVV